jgi:hypothetical protein
MLSDFAGFRRRLLAALGLAVLAAAGTAGAAQADNYGEIAHFGAKGTGSGEFDTSEGAGFGVDPTTNDVYVADLPDENDEFRIQRFDPSGPGGAYEPVAEVKFKPHDAEAKNEEPDEISNIAVDPEKHLIYVLASELRPAKEGKAIDPETYAATELFAYSTAGTSLVPVSPGEPGEEPGVLASVKQLKPSSNKQGVSLLEPNGITVDPSNHEVILLGEEDKGSGSEPPTALERVSDAGVLGQRWVDTTDYLEEDASSPIVTKAGKVLVDNFNQIDEIPANFSEATPPKPVLPFDDEEQLEENEEHNRLTEFPGGLLVESGGGLAIGEEGTIYTRAGITQEEEKRVLEGKLTGSRYPGVLLFSSSGAEEGWTGGQSAASGGGKCTIGTNAPAQVAAGKEHHLFVFDTSFANPKVVEYGPGGEGCAKGKVLKRALSVNGVTVDESQSIPIKDSVELATTLLESNALSVEWEFGDGTPKQTVTTNGYQLPSVEHKFATPGTHTVTETIHTDDLAEPVLVTHIKVISSPPTPTVGAVKAEGVGDSEATLAGTVDPNGAEVTKCEFAYGTTTSYGSTAPCVPAHPGGTGTTAVAVTAKVKGLSPHTTYHFQLVAESAGGVGEEGTSADATLVTGPKPAVVLGSAVGVTETGATLSATVNPESSQVSECEFEYGTTTSYGSTAPCSPSPGSGAAPVAVSAAVGGLSAGTTYHVRVFAANVSGAEYSPDATFTTTEPPHQVCETAECLGGGGSGGGGGGGGTGGGSTGGGGGSMPGSIEGPPAVTVAGTSTSVSSAGAFALKVGCPAGESSCSGTVTIKTAGAVAASVGHEAKKKASILTLATGSFTVSGGQVKTLNLHLSAQGRALLAHSHVLRVKATITARNPGGKSATTTLTLTLRLAAKKSKK